MYIIGMLYTYTYIIKYELFVIDIGYRYRHVPTLNGLISFLFNENNT